MIIHTQFTNFMIYKLSSEGVKHNFQILCLQQLNINYKICNLNNHMMQPCCHQNCSLGD
jgi:hypothetical protein